MLTSSPETYTTGAALPSSCPSAISEAIFQFKSMGWHENRTTNREEDNDSQHDEQTLRTWKTSSATPINKFINTMQT